MTPTSPRFFGGCLCGTIRYEIQRKHLNAWHCYCTMCRKAHGTAFSTHVVARPDQVEWLQGRSDLVSYESSPGAYREFCQNCGTHLLVHQTGDSTLAIPAGTLDGDPLVTIRGHIFKEEAVSWIRVDDDSPRYEGFPPGAGPRDRSG